MVVVMPMSLLAWQTFTLEITIILASERQGMPNQDERRKGLRADLPTGFYFNIIDSIDEHPVNSDSTLKRLGVIDSIPFPNPQTDAQILLSRIDQKLSVIIGILADRFNSKNYSNYALVLDISEFGLAFGHHLKFPDGATIEMGLQITENEQHLLDISGRIVHVKPPPASNPEFVAIYGVEFVNIQSKDQNDIVQLIFSHQREQIRRRREQDS